jgi:hypothetical protein
MRHALDTTAFIRGGFKACPWSGLQAGICFPPCFCRIGLSFQLVLCDPTTGAGRLKKEKRASFWHFLMQPAIKPPLKIRENSRESAHTPLSELAENPWKEFPFLKRALILSAVRPRLRAAPICLL